MPKLLAEAIYEAVATLHKRWPPRKHLGPSEIGVECARSVWYGFRWATYPNFTGRTQLIFNRGHRMEPEICSYLIAVGGEVRPYAERLCWQPGSCDYITVEWERDVPAGFVDVSNEREHQLVVQAQGFHLPQYGFADGHFKGSCDGKVGGLDHFGIVGWSMIEIKTHKATSWRDVNRHGVTKAKPEHYKQLQLYLHMMNMERCLYIAINKDTDELYIELVNYNSVAAEQAYDRAKDIAAAKVAPPRISLDPTFFHCKLCDHTSICHDKAKSPRSCRSCQYVLPQEDGSWFCERHRSLIPEDFIPVSCDKWESII